jgi:c-di-GMP-binding flagellar brake protein YcgR
MHISVLFNSDVSNVLKDVNSQYISRYCEVDFCVIVLSLKSLNSRNNTVAGPFHVTLHCHLTAAIFRLG